MGSSLLLVGGATLAGGIALVCAGALATLLGLPGLVVLLVWRRTRGGRERLAARLQSWLPEQHQPGAARATPVVLWLLDRLVRRRMLPWLALLGAGVAAVVAGIVLLVAG